LYDVTGCIAAIMVMFAADFVSGPRTLKCHSLLTADRSRYENFFNKYLTSRGNIAQEQSLLNGKNTDYKAELANFATVLIARLDPIKF